MEMQLVHAAVDGQLLINSVFLKAIRVFSVRSSLAGGSSGRQRVSEHARAYGYVDTSDSTILCIYV